MPNQRHIEIFSAGCSCCGETIELVRKAACPSCEVTVLDMRNPKVADRARNLGIRSVPAVLIDGQLAECCTTGGPKLETLQALGLGVPLP
jgi:hypothetical protein